MRLVCVGSLYRPGFFLSKNSVGIMWVFTKDVCHTCCVGRKYLKLPPQIVYSPHRSSVIV